MRARRLLLPLTLTLNTMLSYHHRKIDSVRDLLETLKAGPYAWPGGYPLYFITHDGDTLSFDGVKDYGIPESCRDIRDEWFCRIVACDVNWEDPYMICAQTNEPIESAYGDPDETNDIIDQAYADAP